VRQTLYQVYITTEAAGVENQGRKHLLAKEQKIVQPTIDRENDCSGQHGQVRVTFIMIQHVCTPQSHAAAAATTVN